MKPTLLVLAAGMGSRFGGLKQMEPVGPNGEWLLDYSVRDASRAGFAKVVFVIRPEMETEFRAMTEAKYSDQLEIAYAFQEKSDIPIPVENLESRVKPWGTGHAVYAARESLQSAFAVINADDFYGAEAFEELARFLEREETQSQQETYALVGYRLANTLSPHGTVSRGICRSDEDGNLLSIEEHSEIGRTDDGAAILALDAAGQPVELAPDTLVSLNCWGFPAGWANRLEPLFKKFLEERAHEPKSEFHLPAAVHALVSTGRAQARALPCNAQWFGVTHREDLAETRAALRKLAER